MGMSGGSSGSSSSGQSWNDSLAQSVNQAFSQGTSGQNVWSPQGEALQGMYGQASGQLPGSIAQSRQAAAQGVRQAMPGMQAAQSNLMSLAQSGGAAARYATPNNALAQRQSNDLAQQVGQAFNREILPGITGASIGAGGLGGSRDALARGVAAGDAARAISQGSTDLYAQQYGIGAQAASQADATRLAAAQGLPGASEAIFNLGMMPSMAMWAPMTAAAGIFGGPTALSSSQNTSGSYGLSQAQSRGEAWNSSESRSSQFGFNFF